MNVQDLLNWIFIPCRHYLLQQETKFDQGSLNMFARKHKNIAADYDSTLWCIIKISSWFAPSFLIILDYVCKKKVLAKKKFWFLKDILERKFVLTTYSSSVLNLSKSLAKRVFYWLYDWSYNLRAYNNQSTVRLVNQTYCV